MKILDDFRLSRRPMAGFMVIGLGWGGYSAMVPPVKAQIDASDALYGGLMLVAALGAVVSVWLSPTAVKWLGRWALVVAALCIATGFSLSGQAMAPAALAAALFLAASGSAVADVIANAEISEREARHKRTLMNLNHAMYSFAFAGGAVLSGILREARWQPSNALPLIGLGIVLLCAFMHTRREPPMMEDEDSHLPSAVPMGLVWVGGFVMLAAFSSEAATEGWSALHLERTLGGDAGHGAMGPALFGLTMGIGRLFGHGLAARFSDLGLMTAGCLIAGAGLALAGGAPSVMIAYVGFACAGIGISVVVPLGFALIGRSVPERIRLATITRVSGIAHTAFFLGPPLMGAVAQVIGLRASFALVGIILVAVALLLMPVLGRHVTRLSQGPDIRPPA